jgi:hypothetical protein
LTTGDFDLGNNSDFSEEGEPEKQMVEVAAGPAEGKLAEQVNEVEILVLDEAGGPPLGVAGDTDKVVFLKFRMNCNLFAQTNWIYCDVATCKYRVPPNRKRRITEHQKTKKCPK